MVIAWCRRYGDVAVAPVAVAPVAVAPVAVAPVAVAFCMIFSTDATQNNCIADCIKHTVSYK